MTTRITKQGFISRASTPAVIVTLFVLAMSACVLGLVVWKSYDARHSAMLRSETEMRNLAHSLAEHASHTIQSVDVVLDDMAAFLRSPNAGTARLNARLQEIVHTLPQLRDIAVLDREGRVRFASLRPVPPIDNGDRSYFIHHRDYADSGLLITGPLVSRSSGEPVIVLSRRISSEDGSFNGVVVATVESEYFTNFYRTFDLGRYGGLTLFQKDGKVIVQWPSMKVGQTVGGVLFTELMPASPIGYRPVVSPFDGRDKYYAYETTREYPLVVTVARTEDSILAGWYRDLRSDVAVGAALLAIVLLLAALLAVQLRQRERIARMLREREARYRLIETNIADIVILADRDGTLTFVSMSVKSVLGITPDQMLGRNCLDIVHPDDTEAVRHYGTRLGQNGAGRRVEFRTTRADGTLIWLEAHFRVVADGQGSGRNIVGTLRDITRRKQVEDEVDALNFRLAQMATTDALTGLPNRRALDDQIGRAFDDHQRLAVLMIDVDEFKSFNDTLGHQAGDLGLQRIAELLAHEVADTKGMAARYGGEEFAIILPGADIAAALTFAEKLRSGVRDLKIANPAAGRGIVTISIGIADKTGPAPNATTLLRDADMALYEAKRRGRDCSVAASLLITDDAPLAPSADPSGFGAIA